MSANAELLNLGFSAVFLLRRLPLRSVSLKLLFRANGQPRVFGCVMRSEAGRA